MGWEKKNSTKAENTGLIKLPLSQASQPHYILYGHFKFVFTVILKRVLW